MIPSHHETQHEMQSISLLLHESCLHETKTFEAIVLRLPYRNDAKIAEISNLWTFWHVIQPISHLFKI